MTDEPTPPECRIVIVAFGRSVEVAANGVDLADVAETARSLFRELRDVTASERIGSTVGFAQERAPATTIHRNKTWGGEIAPVRGEGVL